jgi:hypothetical protein
MCSFDEKLKATETTLRARGISDYYKICGNNFVMAVHIPKMHIHHEHF